MKLKVGQKVIKLKNGKTEIVTVTKVGHKYFYCGHEKFYLDNGENSDNDNIVCFETQSELNYYLTKINIAEIELWLKGYARACFEKTEQIVKIIRG